METYCVPASYDIGINVETIDFRGDKNGASLSDLSDADLGRIVNGLAQGLVSDRVLAAIAMAGLRLHVNGVPAQHIIDEVRRRRINFSECFLP